MDEGVNLEASDRVLVSYFTSELCARRLADASRLVVILVGT